MKQLSRAMHVSLHVSDLSASCAFYAALFGLEPSKVRAGYGKFELSHPALVLSLLESPGPLPSGALSHLGIRLESGEQLASERARIQAGGLRITLEEQQVDCCYARQDKFWVPDPDGNAWEFYVFLGDQENTPMSGDAQACCGPEMACSAEIC